MVTKTTQIYFNWEYGIVIQIGLNSKRVSVKIEIPKKDGHWILALQKHAKRKIRDKFWLLAVGPWKTDKPRKNLKPTDFSYQEGKNCHVHHCISNTKLVSDTL